MKMKPKWAWATLALCQVAAVGQPVLAAPAVSQPPLQGADAVLRQIAPQGEPTPAPAGAAENKIKELRQDIQSFGEKVNGLETGEAVRGWLALADRYGSSVSSLGFESQNSLPVSFREIVGVLPPPSSWDALAQAIAQREPWKPKKPIRDLALLLLAHALKGDKAAIWKDEALLQARLVNENSLGNFNRATVIPQLRSALTLIAERKGVVPTFSSAAEYYGRTVSHAVLLDDLVTKEGYQKASVHIRQALLTQSNQIEIPVGDETRRLAARLALQSIKQLKSPQWILAQSPDAISLFEALNKRFPGTAGARGPFAAEFKQSRTLAQVYYMLGLIVVNRTGEAVKLAQVLGYTEGIEVPAVALENLDKAGHTRALNSFLHDLLAKNPNLPFWGQYISTAARTGATGPMLALVRATSTRKGVSKAKVLGIRVSLYKALLAADKVEEGVAVLRQLLASNALPAAPSREGSRLSLAAQLAQVGHIARRNDWKDEGVRILQAELSKAGSYQVYEEDGPELLVKLGRADAAEQVFIARLKNGAGQRGSAYARLAYIRSGSSSTTLQPLIGLVGIYSRSGRHRDVLTLLKDAPGWGEKDLSKIYSNYDASGTVLGYAAAAALAATGERERAVTILKAVINSAGGYDPAYKLLILLEGQNSLPFLDEVFNRNRFEERPLIWKARLQQQKGDLVEAETTIRAAIAIDPSDGEEGKGDRMRAYAVLADIRAALGDAGQAKFFRGAVKAIRVAEDADDLNKAGLLQRSIRLYEHALTYFSDAYCIQSRLAIKLADLGKTEEAEVHYRRAYELMPDSFGRMESHCLGCERAFAGARAESTAERVFKKFLAKEPKKPQIHYLLGYLREEQGRYNAALPLYKEAVRLDPDYLNAWKHIQGLASYMQLSAADRDAAAFNLLRLQPQGGDISADLSRVSSLRLLWNTVAKAADKKGPAVPESMYALTASIPLAEKNDADMKKSLAEYGLNDLDEYTRLLEMSAYSDYDFDYPGMETSSLELSGRAPANAIASHRTVKAIGRVLDIQQVREYLPAM